MKTWSKNLPIKKEDLYWNEAKVKRVIDGDTIETQGILSFNFEHGDLDLRLNGLFCFETRKPSNERLDKLMPHLKAIGVGDRLELIARMKKLGALCKDAMENLVMGEELAIKTYKTTFNRYVADVYRQRDGVNLVEWMLDNKFGQVEDPSDQAKPYFELLMYWKDKL